MQILFFVFVCVKAMCVFHLCIREKNWGDIKTEMILSDSIHYLCKYVLEMVKGMGGDEAVGVKAREIGEKTRG